MKILTSLIIADTRLDRAFLVSSFPCKVSLFGLIQERKEHIFCLNYVTVDDCLPQMCQLHRASTLPPADQSAMVGSLWHTVRNTLRYLKL